MSKLVLSAPLIFLALTDPKRGPPLLRAVLQVVKEQGLEVGDGWGQYVYEQATNRPKDESVSYNILK